MGTSGNVPVKCGTCGATIYQTTKLYDPNEPLNGAMITLMEPYKSYNWPTYDGALESVATSKWHMCCTRCAGLVAPDGKLVFAEEKDQVDAIIVPVETLRSPVLKKKSKKKKR